MAAAAIDAKPTDSLRLSLAGIGIVAFVVTLFVAQVFTGAPMAYAGLVSLFIAIGFTAVKVLGGPTTLLGLSVTVLMLQHVIVSQVAKVLFLQSPVDRMLVPYQTMLVYNLAALGILSAACLYRVLRIDHIKPLFELELNYKRLTLMAAVLTVFAIVRFFVLQRFGVFEGAGGGVYIGGVVGPLRQFGFLSSLAVTTGTAAVIVKSNGTRCIGIWNSLAILAPILYGIIGAGRQDAASSAVTFVLTLYAFRFKLRAVHYISIAVMAYLLQVIIFPYALYARGKGEVRLGTFDQRIVKAANLLLDVTLHPGKYKEEQSVVDPRLPWAFQRMFYYGKPISTLDRYSVILSTDNIVNAVLQRGPQGPATALAGFGMLLPRFLNPEKEALGTSNTIAHYGEGLVNVGDPYTQITLGMVPDGFYGFSWFGAFFIPFIVSLAYFIVYRLMFRPSMFNNVYVTALLFISTWVYSESTVQEQTLAIFQTTIYYVVSVLPLVMIGHTITRRVREAKFVYEADPEDEAALPALEPSSSAV